MAPSSAEKPSSTLSIPLPRSPPTAVDYTSPRRRYFETSIPGRRRRLFVKRSIMPGEYPQPDRLGQPLQGALRAKESLINQARAIEYVRKNTTVPVPKPIAAFEDRGAFYLIQEHLAGILAQNAPASAHPYIVTQLEGFVRQLKGLRSDTVRSFVDGHLFTVPRLVDADLFSNATYAPKKDGYVLCHGDLGWHNITVDPDTFKITAIFDWEYAGFFPEGMDGEHWRRQGLASAHCRGDRVDTTDITRSLYDVGLRPLREKSTDDEGTSKVERLSMYEGVCVAPPHAPRTELQKRIRQLDLGYPTDIPITHRTVGIQQGICTRRSIAESIDALAVDLKEDVSASSSWPRGSEDLAAVSTSKGEIEVRSTRSLEYEAVSLEALYSLLPTLHHQLAEKLEASHLPLLIARDSLAYVPIPDIGQPVPATMQVKVSEGDEGTTKEVSIRAFRADTYRQFSQRLLLLSHAALHLLPYLPIGEDVQPFTRERILADHRAKDILEGGDGGWKVDVSDDPDIVTELAKRDGAAVAAWGLKHDHQVAEAKLKQAEKLAKEKLRKERKERLTDARSQEREAWERAKAEVEAGAIAANSGQVKDLV